MSDEQTAGKPSYLAENLGEREKRGARTSSATAIGDRRMRTVLVSLLACAALTACGGGGDARTLSADSASGDVPADSAMAGLVYRGEKYPLTSDNYRRWLVAQAALDSLPAPADVPRIDVNAASDEQIDRTIDFLSRQDGERRAIEGSGLSVKDFVLTSVALGRMVRASARGGDALADARGFAGIDPEAVRRAQDHGRFRIVDDEDDDEHELEDEDEGEHDGGGGRAGRHRSDDHGEHGRGRGRGHRERRD